MALTLRFAHHNVMTIKNHPYTYELEDMHGRTYVLGNEEMASVALDFGWDPEVWPRNEAGDIEWEDDDFQAEGAQYLHSLLGKNVWVHDEGRYFEWPQRIDDPMKWQGGDPTLED